MISDWETKKFGDCAFLVKEIINPTEAPSTYYVGLEHIGESSLSLLSFGESESVESSKYKFKKGDILFGKLRPYFRKVVIAPFDGICSTDIWVVRAKDGIDQNFLFYWMASNKFVDAASRGSEGTRMPRAKWDFVSQLEELIPSYKEQKCIANLLSSLSKKIEHNNCQNEILDKIARAIFKSWFIDFDPVRAKAEGKQPFGMDEETAALFPSEFEDSELGEIPSGWGVVKLGDHVNIIRDTINPADYPDEPFYHYSLPSYDAGKEPVIEKGASIKSNKTLVSNGCVLISKLNPTTPRTWFPSINNTVRSICSTEFIVFRPKPPLTGDFAYSLISSDEFSSRFETLVTGTSGSHQRVRRGDFENLDIIMPPNNLVDAFSQIIHPLNKIQSQNMEQSKVLGKIRDILIPKLLSGEIRVPMEAD